MALTMVLLSQPKILLLILQCIDSAFCIDSDLDRLGMKLSTMFEMRDSYIIREP